MKKNDFNTAPIALSLIMMLLMVPGLSTAAVSLTRTGFQTATSGYTMQVEGFDNYSDGQTLTSTPDFSMSTSSGQPIVTSAYVVSTTPNGLGLTTYGYFGPADTITFSFNTPIHAFAIDINTFADQDGDFSATINTTSGQTEIYSIFSPVPTYGQFIGFVSNTPFTDVTIAAEANYSYTLDTVQYGNVSAVPVPAAVWLFGSAILSLFGVRRFKSDI